MLLLAANDASLNTQRCDTNRLDSELSLPRVLPSQSIHQTLGPEAPIAPIPTWSAPSIQGHKEIEISNSVCTKRTDETSEGSIQFIPYDEEASITKKRKREISLSDGKVSTVLEAFNPRLVDGYSRLKK